MKKKLITPGQGIHFHANIKTNGKFLKILSFGYRFSPRNPRLISAQLLLAYFYLVLFIKLNSSGSTAVECLTQDQGSAGSSLTGVTVLCP